MFQSKKPPPPQSSHPCSHCPRVFPTAGRRSRHEATHDGGEETWTQFTMEVLSKVWHNSMLSKVFLMHVNSTLTTKVMPGPYHVHIVGNNSRAGWSSTCTQGGKHM